MVNDALAFKYSTRRAVVPDVAPNPLIVTLLVDVRVEAPKPIFWLVAVIWEVPDAPVKSSLLLLFTSRIKKYPPPFVAR